VSSASLDNYLRRYVSLDDALKYLEDGKIVLGEYSHWKDQNEQAALDAYEKVKGLEQKSLRITCFTQAVETYHHWSVYGKHGVCFIFKKEALMKSAEAAGLTCKSVEYIKINQLDDNTAPESWPFLKRLPFKDEREFRVIGVGDKDTIKLTADMIDRIYISPLMSGISGNNAKEVILKRFPEGAEKVSVFGTTLLENPQWVKYFQNQK
jgi:hypothetical protein